MKKSTTQHVPKYIHFTAKELLQPYNPVTVNLIGAGGTGSQMLTALARTSQALTALGHPGLFVRVFDDDKVERANLARQLFTTAELKQYKSAALISRINRFFGTNWKAVTRKFDRHTIAEQPGLAQASLTLSCVDTVAARFSIAEILKTTALQKTNLNQRDRPLYLMDFGNSRDSGQVILSTIGEVEQPASKKFSAVAYLPDVTEEFGDLLRSSEQTDHTPSCSLADALRKQDLFVNTALTGLGASLLWQFFREGMLFNRGFFMNLHDLRVQPLSVASAVHQPIAAA